VEVDCGGPEEVPKGARVGGVVDPFGQFLLAVIIVNLTLALVVWALL
jgi:hypothetical protein